MQEKDLLEKFRDYLYINHPHKKELVTLLADILRMEKESVSRRLKGEVQFTVREIGIIAQRLNISIDNFLTDPKDRAVFLSVDLLMPLSIDSIDSLFENIKEIKNKLKTISNDNLQVGYIFSTLPLEFYAPYPNLSKFMYFKWAYHFTNSGLITDYTKWQLPETIHSFQEEIIDSLYNFKSIFYIWDNAVIWNLVKEINLFHQIHIIGVDDLNLIKKDLHNMLNNIEKHISNVDSEDAIMRPFDLYISSINIGISCIYYYSDKHALIDYQAPFVWSGPREDSGSFDKVYKWINSMKRVSTLISGSGVIERRLFFDEQHKIIDGKK